MATYEATSVASDTTFSRRLVRFLRRMPVHVTLLMVTVIWLIPTLGLAVASFRPRSEIGSVGWWHAFFHPNWTLHNYGNVIHSAGMGHAFLNSLYAQYRASR